MASTITAATITVKISESIKLNGSQQGGTNTFTIADINNVSKRIINIPTSERTIINMGTNPGAGMFIESEVRYIRITNKDNAYHVGLIFQNENNDEFGVKLDWGQSFIYNADRAGGVVDTMDAVDNAGLSTNTFADLVSITAIADTAAVDLEIFVASV
jgi:hypothetical protein